MLVASAGTGGTITGIARKLKEKCPGCKVSARAARGLWALPGARNSATKSGGWESTWVALKGHCKS